LIQSLNKVFCWYPHAEKVFIALDNWPVHKHPRVLEALARQPKVVILWLPTYAPWLNPIEKLWRWLKQRVTHAHPWCDDFIEYRHHIQAELTRLADEPAALLKYVGLSM